MNKKTIKISIIIILMLAIILVAIYLSSQIKNYKNNVFYQGKSSYSLNEINKDYYVSLPIKNADEAVKYSLTLKDVKSGLNKPIIINGVDYSNSPWSVHAYRNGINETNELNDINNLTWGWSIVWYKLNKDCHSGPAVDCEPPFISCQIVIADSGRIINNFTCRNRS